MLTNEEQDTIIQQIEAIDEQMESMFTALSILAEQLPCDIEITGDDGSKINAIEFINSILNKVAYIGIDSEYSDGETNEHKQEVFYSEE